MVLFSFIFIYKSFKYIPIHNFACVAPSRALDAGCSIRMLRNAFAATRIWVTLHLFKRNACIFIHF